MHPDFESMGRSILYVFFMYLERSTDSSRRVLRISKFCFTLERAGCPAFSVKNSLWAYICCCWFSKSTLKNSIRFDTVLSSMSERVMIVCYFWPWCDPTPSRTTPWLPSWPFCLRFWVLLRLPLSIKKSLYLSKFFFCCLLGWSNWPCVLD